MKRAILPMTSALLWISFVSGMVVCIRTNTSSFQNLHGIPGVTVSGQNVLFPPDVQSEFLTYFFNMSLPHHLYILYDDTYEDDDVDDDHDHNGDGDDGDDDDNL
ncbi:hypothetical protein SK128_001034 [Halocaridina rubra]|uniref:Transmembrane protein n=1 Tax=Halocaridina rubra TaxID=373956 RepID=A0AAN8XCF5_HALRR